MTARAHLTPTGILVRLPSGELRFLPESEELYQREKEVGYAPMRLTTAQRVAKYLSIPVRSVRVVKTRKELA